jgi:hypothetical protein
MGVCCLQQTSRKMRLTLPSSVCTLQHAPYLVHAAGGSWRSTTVAPIPATTWPDFMLLQLNQPLL